tara:strand:- start:17845 stop:19095 length:1251 start_codon:yes stop_codon:yes gene_type:complete
MKLLTKTSLNFISTSVVFIMIGIILIYFSIRNIVDKDLNNRLLDKKNQFQTQIDFSNIKDLKTTVVKIDDNIGILFDNFSDTVLILDGKYELYRKLESSIFLNEELYKIEILESHNKSDILIMKISIMIIGFILFFFISLFFVNRHSIKSALSVLYSTIKQIEDVDVTKVTKLQFEDAETDEIKKLIEAFERMSEKIHQDYESLKQYTENVSHELQTPLAIISSKTEQLLQGSNLNEYQVKELADLLESTNRLSKINQSLIFLTKIDNHFYKDEKHILINEIVKQKILFYDSLLKIKNIKMEVKYIQDNYVYINQYLAESLIQNLIKNAIVHSEDASTVFIQIKNNLFKISNQGNKLPFDSKDIFNRFIKSGNNKGLGIGLSVVKSICDLYSFKLRYVYDGSHNFIINFRNKKNEN